MSIVESGPGAGLVERVKAILLRPSPTWEVIDTEPATAASLYRGYACILAAIPPLAQLIGGLTFGYGAWVFSYRPNPAAAVVQALVLYLLSLASVFVLALVIEALAANFGGQKSRIQALKVAVYSTTAGWVGGVFGLYPPLAGIGSLIGLYGLYLLYTGLPRLMKAPQAQALAYTAVTVIVAIVLYAVAGLVAASVGGAGLMGATLAQRAPMTGQVNLPGGTSVNLAELEAAAKQAEAAAEQLQAGTPNGAVTPIDPEALKARLPVAVAGFSRGEVSSASGGAGGITGSSAQATYERGDARMQVVITDMGAVGAMAGLASAFNLNSRSESGGAYEKIGKVGGRMTTESYNPSTRHGEYTVVAGNRVMIAARGDGVTIEELKAAVAAADPGRIEALARAG